MAFLIVAKEVKSEVKCLVVVVELFTREVFDAPAVSVLP